MGLGNIAGVAIAISVGGPGATFWMIMAGFLGMASKFTECSLGQMYRQERPDGSIMGGAMYYLSRGLADMGLGFLGKILAVFFVILCIGGSLGGGNTFQVNQSLRALSETIPWLEDHGWVYGVVMTVLVGAVILGGIKSIAKVAEKIVPTMCGVYVIACLIVILGNVGGAGCLRDDHRRRLHAHGRIRRDDRRARPGLQARGLLERGRRRVGGHRPLGGEDTLSRA